MNEASEEQKAVEVEVQVKGSKAGSIHSEGTRRLWQDSRFRAKMAQIHRKLWQDPEYRENMAKAQREANHDGWPEASKKKWQDPEYVLAVAKGRRARPTVPEQKLMSIVDKNMLPFKYNGDSLGITIAGLLPDFIDTNGSGAVIEIFGEYWHLPREMIEKEVRYNSVGYRCLVIWDFEIYRMPAREIVDMIRSHSST